MCCRKLDAFTRLEIERRMSRINMSRGLEVLVGITPGLIRIAGTDLSDLAWATISRSADTVARQKSAHFHLVATVFDLPEGNRVLHVEITRVWP
ncbi:MAG: hypothetical protein ABIO70_10375 [Pseudomonadota bacterium]